MYDRGRAWNVIRLVTRILMAKFFRESLKLRDNDFFLL